MADATATGSEWPRGGEEWFEPAVGAPTRYRLAVDAPVSTTHSTGLAGEVVEIGGVEGERLDATRIRHAI